MNSRLLLYTWHDVDVVLKSAMDSRRLPANWVGFDVSPVALVIQIGDTPASGTEDSAWAALTELFSARASRERNAILLEANPGQERLLDVHFEYIPGITRTPRPARPLFQGPPLSEDDVLEHQLPSVPVVAFYSYKGGVGRTLSMLGMARTLVLRDLEAGFTPRPLLIVDADYEAPGLTWLAQQDGRFQEFSMQDALALVHGAADWKAEALPLIAERVKSETLRLPVGGRVTEHFFLPAFRSQAQLLTPPVRPDQLLRGPGRRWIMADLLSALGQILGASAVLVDCRAGISELSAPVLLDPRVKRVIVTSTSLQSVEGTTLILRELRRKIPATIPDVDSSLMITMVPTDPRFRLGESVRETLIRVWLDAGSNDDSDQSELMSEPLPVLELPFSNELVHLSDLVDIDNKLTRAGHEPSLRMLAEKILPIRVPSQVAVPVSQDESWATLNTLADFCHRQEYAESSQTGAFLRTVPLKSLARKFSSEPPRAVVMGAKGAGKTFTYLQLVREGDWRTFVRSMGVDSTGICTHPVMPLVRPRHLDLDTVEMITNSWSKVHELLGTSSTLTPDGVAERLQGHVTGGLTDEIGWRDFWLQMMAQTAGIADGIPDPLLALQDKLEKANRYLTFTVDGLEDWLPGAQTEKVQQAAILGLCLSVLEKLIGLPNRRVGLVVFIRKDLPQAVLKQNFGQFERLHEAYELRWSIDEAQRLVLWAVKQAGVDKTLWRQGLPDDLSAYVGPELEERLLPLWGLKLGTDTGNEAYSTNWVVSALSDFHGRILARDLVRFLHHAAQGSKTTENQRKSDRLLQIAAVKGAIRPCGEKRIDDIKQEIPALAKTLDEIRAAPESLRRMPFTWDTFGLSSEQVQLLMSQGVVYEEEGKLYTPEIYRQGLRLGLATGARPKVITLMRRALNQRG